MEPEVDIIDLVGDRVQLQLEAVDGDALKLPAALQPVAILATVQGLIDNGGFQYLFESEFPLNPPYAVFVNAYRQIGANEAADSLARAVALFPFRDPERNVAARIEYMDGMGDSHEMIALGNQVCGDERVWTLLRDYISRNREAFFDDQQPANNE